jgi:hypothetical protein
LVTITGTSSDPGEGVPVSALTFSGSNWNIGQAMVLQGIDDNQIDLAGASAFTVSFSVTSSTAAYQNSDMADVTATNTDRKPSLIYLADFQLFILSCTLL